MSKPHPELQSHAAASDATNRLAHLMGTAVIYHPKVLEQEADRDVCRELGELQKEVLRLTTGNYQLLQKLGLQAQFHSVHSHIREKAEAHTKNQMIRPGTCHVLQKGE